ncbi:hypothetical protein HXX76_010788 [Chlamydomonas incerta]|uniref:Prefoldin subunit 1 n=1 Tax=Chlamydomonas incerta TaxID=51695 RepID=A0A835VXJ1_CHLIN|nr:hypothetical protein HXX76_010788 [Chlamydomonas incerta]|eukprot:KAG2429553.1 hypothetical protein HXX76_010788 [Chlamydomonas incerta]
MADKEEERVLQEFSELQEKVMVQSEVMNRIMQQERMIGVHKQRAVLTKTELSAMPDSATMYKSIGKAYFASPKADILKNLDDTVSQYESDSKKLKDQREAIDQKMKDTEAQIRELLAQSPTLVRRLGAVRIQ